MALKDRKIGGAHVDIGGRIAPLKKAMAKAKALFQKGMKTMARWAKRGAIALGVGLASGIILSIKAAASFESQMAKVATMLSKQTMKYIPRFGRAIKDLAIKFGEGTVSITKGLYSILSASIAAGKAIRFLRTAMMAGKGGFTDTATAAYVLTGVMNAYGYAADKVGKVSDILFTLQKKGQTSFAQFAPVLGRVTSIAAAMGVRLEEVIAALATLTRSGISTAESITYLRGLIVSLSGRSKESIELAKQHGIELSVVALQAEGLTGMLEKLSKVSDDVLKDIIKETEARTALSVLIKNQVGYLDDLDDVMHSAGETAKAQAKVTTTLTEKFKSLWQSIKALATDTGEIFMPAMKKAVDSLIEKFSSMRDNLAALWYGVNKDITKFLDILLNIASAKLRQLAKNMGVYGQRAADAFSARFHERLVKWYEKYFPTVYALLHKKWEKQQAEKLARLEAGYKKELNLNKEIAEAKIALILKAANVEEGVQKYLSMIAAERARWEGKEAADKAKEAEEEAKRLKTSEENKARLAAKLAAERKKDIDDAAKAEEDAIVTKLEKLRNMYASMKGYEREHAKVQRALWKIQAKKYAKTGLIAAEAAYAGLAARAKEAAKPMDKAAEVARAGFIGLTEMWRALSTTATPIERRMENLAREHLAETKEVKSGIQRLVSLEGGRREVLVQ